MTDVALFPALEHVISIHVPMKGTTGEPGVIVHHKIELTPRNIDDPAIALGEDNLETVCRTCHALIHEGTPPLADGLAFDADGNIITAPHTPRDAPK